MSKILRLPAAAIAASVALHTGVAVSPDIPSLVDRPLIAQAGANNSDTIPDLYHIQKAPDAETYAAELNAYLRISKARHLLHTAASAQKYENYFSAPQSVRDAADYSEQACYAAKGRLALAILKAEGNETARSINISAVGFDANATATAAALLTAATAEAAKHAFGDGPDSNEWSTRHKFFSEGADRTKELDAALRNGTPDPREADAYSVINWGVAQTYISGAETTVGYTMNSLAGVSVYNLVAPSAFDASAAKAVARQTEQALTAEFGTPAKPGTPTPPVPEQPGGEHGDIDTHANAAKAAAEEAKTAAEQAKAAAEEAKKDAAQAAVIRAAIEQAEQAAKRAEEAAKQAEQAAKQAEQTGTAAAQALADAQRAREHAEAAKKAAEEAAKQSKPEPKQQRGGFFRFFDGLLSASVLGVLLVSAMTSLGLIG